MKASDYACTGRDPVQALAMFRKIMNFTLLIFLTMIMCVAKLPKWFGERPGKKPGDPESPEDEDEGPTEAPPGTFNQGRG